MSPADVLARIEQAIDAARTSGAVPVVVVDIDSTVVLAGERHRRILVEFAEQHPDPRVRAVAHAATTDDFRWSVDEPLARAGLSTLELRAALLPFWRERFFADAYGELDLPFPGAVQVVRGWADRGATIAWLTARPASTMASGTLRLLRRWGFPVLDGRALLVMKEDDVEDGAHKVRAFSHLADRGQVIAVLDNEPAHVNAAARAFPAALAVLVGSICSPEAPDLVPSALRLSAWG